MNEELNEENQFDDEAYSSSLQIGGDIHKLSDIFIDEFPHLPKEIKYAFFDRKDLYTVRGKSAGYWDFKHFKKIIVLSEEEMKLTYVIRKKFFNITKEEDLKSYFKSVNKQYLYDNINSLDKEEKEKALNAVFSQIKESKQMGYVDTLYNEQFTFNEAFNYFTETFGYNPNVDSLGLLNSMFTITESSKGFDGKERKSINTTISESRNIDELKQNEEDSKDESVSGWSKVTQSFRRKN